MYVYNQKAVYICIYTYTNIIYYRFGVLVKKEKKVFQHLPTMIFQGT